MILPAALTAIGDYAFHTCESLTKIELPAALTSIGRGAFGCCSSLESIHMPKNGSFRFWFIRSYAAWCFHV